MSECTNGTGRTPDDEPQRPSSILPDDFDWDEFASDYNMTRPQVIVFGRVIDDHSFAKIAHDLDCTRHNVDYLWREGKRRTGSRSHLMACHTAWKWYLKQKGVLGDEDDNGRQKE